MQREFTPMERSQGISLKRGLALVFMSFLAPGSAQIAYGKRHYGLWMWRFLGFLLLTILLLVVGFFTFRKFTIGIYANGIFPQVLAYLIIALGVADILLLWHAWYLAGPRRLSKIGVTMLTALALFFSVVIGGVTHYAYGIFASQAKLFGKVFIGSGEVKPINGRINILLIGADSAETRAGRGIRTDSMTVASISAETGRAVLFSLARNTEHVPFPDYSPMKKLYPKGFYCPDKRGHSECLLNAVYTYATQNKDKYSGVKDPGLQATIEAAEGFTGLKLNYWVLVDMDGFEKLIDAMGGITLDIIKPVPVGEDGNIRYYLPAGKDVKLNGDQALWFARSRANASDYVRMLRQKCVMNAFLHKMDPYEVMKHFTEIASASADMISTNIPATGIEELAKLALQSKKFPVKTVNFVPPLIKTYNPDWNFVHQKVKDTIADSEKLDKEYLEASKNKTEDSSASAKTAETKTEKPIQDFQNVKQPGASIAAKGELKNGETDNLDEICSAK